MNRENTGIRIPESERNLLSNASITARKKATYSSRTSLQELMKETEGRINNMDYTKVLAQLPQFIEALPPFEKCVFVKRYQKSMQIWEIAYEELVHHDIQRITTMSNEIIRVIRKLKQKFEAFCDSL